MDIIIKREKSPETLRLIETCQEIPKPGNLWIKFDSNSNQKLWVARRLDKRGRSEVAAIDLELVFRNNGKSRWGGRRFELNEPKPSSSKEQKKTLEQNTKEPEPVSSTEESKVAKSSSNFPIVDLKDYDIAEKVMYNIQINHVIKKPNT